MPKSYPELQVFSILDKEKISKIVNVLDESIVRDQFNSTKIKDLEKLGFTHEQSRDIIKCFVNLYHVLQHSDRLKKFLNDVDIKDDIKQRIVNACEVLKEKADKAKVAIAITSEEARKFGHNHLHSLEITSEFRPIVEDNKLQKIIMMIVINGSMQNTDHTEKTPIDFQIELKDFENLVQELDKELKQVKMEVKILQEKLGDDIVSV